MRKLLLVLVLAAPFAAHANKAWGPFPGAGSITISGPGIPAQTATVTQYYGEWFITPKTAHANVTLLNSNPWPRSFSLTFSLDGLAKTQTITGASNSATVGPGKLAFGYSPPGGKLQLTLGKSDSVTFTITKLDDLSFEATFSGTTTDAQTGAGPVQITGTFSLHRLKHVELRSGTWIDCDPVIHDAYALVIPRSASECEVKYDLHAREALNKALEPVVAAMQAQQWILNAPLSSKPVDSENRGTETSPYEAAASLSFYLNKSSPVYQHNQKVLDDSAAQMKSKMSTGGLAANPQLMQQMAKQIADNTLPTSFYLGTLINLPQAEVVNFSRKHTVTQLPGIGTEVFLEDGQPPTGGGDGAPVTWILIGSWLPPIFEPLGDHEKAIFRGGLNPARPLLSAQNYRLVIYATHAQAEKVIGAMNWAPILALLAEKNPAAKN